MPAYFFVCGVPKFGTTWLQNILDMHPDVSCGGEGHFIEKLTRPLNGVVKEYNAKMRVVHEQVYQGRSHYPPLTQAEYDQLCHTLIAGAILRKPGALAATWLGDKTPGYTEQLDRLIGIFPDARIFHIVRDPRDMIVSRLHHARRAGLFPSVASAPAEMRSQLVDAYIDDWARSISAVQAFRKSHAAALSEVRYEDLLAEPSSEVERIFRSLGIDLDEAERDRIVAASDFEQMSSGVARGANDPGSFFRSGIAGEYHDVLTAAEQERVLDRLGSLMRLYQYEQLGSSLRTGASFPHGRGAVVDGEQWPASGFAGTKFECFLNLEGVKSGRS